MHEMFFMFVICFFHFSLSIFSTDQSQSCIKKKGENKSSDSISSTFAISPIVSHYLILKTMIWWRWRNHLFQLWQIQVLPHSYHCQCGSPHDDNDGGIVDGHDLLALISCHLSVFNRASSSSLEHFQSGRSFCDIFDITKFLLTFFKAWYVICS
jgi:hypothetical protein